MRIGLIDGDILAYRAGFAVEKTWYLLTTYNEEFDERVTLEFKYAKDLKVHLEQNLDCKQEGDVVKEVRLEPVENALSIVRSMIDSVVKECECDEYIVYLSGDSNYRKEIEDPLREYKGNRKEADKPVHIHDIRHHLIKHYDAHVSVYEEADDEIGIAAVNYAKDAEPVICTIDKDLDMIPGLHYNFVKEELYYIDDNTADLNFWKQMMTGDTTDNVPGLKGWGEKKSNALIEELCGDVAAVEKEVLHLYEQQFGDEWERRANEQALMLWIRREIGEMKCVVK